MVPRKTEDPLLGELDPIGCHKLIDSSPGCVILDVRTPAEYSEGHLAGAQNVDFFCPDFRAQIESRDHDRIYVIYCRKGNRGARTRDLMKNFGFYRVVNIRGGLEGWKQAGLPTTK